MYRKLIFETISSSEFFTGLDLGFPLRRFFILFLLCHQNLCVWGVQIKFIKWYQNLSTFS